MIVDSSALLAVILAEAEEAEFLRALASASRPQMSIASYLEVALKLDPEHGGKPDPVLDATIARLGIELIPVSFAHGWLARGAAIEFGRGTPARLNFGDCLTYALAKSTGEPLLFKGNDFIHTDLPRFVVAA